jgi:Cof subfamily protein (haloacid dehalogenase superfamily)
MPPIRLVGIDVDGTLVGASGQVLPIVWEAAARARQAGIHLALCSGRPAFGLALDYARQLDSSGWHVFQNGASVLHLESSRSLSAQIATDLVHTLVAEARRTGRVLELYSDREYVAESAHRWAYEHAELLGIPFQPRPFESLRSAIVRAQWLVLPAEASAVIDTAPPHLEVAQSSSPIMPDTRFIGLTREGINKGTAMQMIAREYDVPLTQVMYVGDAGNDLSALQVVGVPVAMANADAAVIAAAAHIAGDVEEGGLVKALDLAIASNGT